LGGNRRPRRDVAVAMESRSRELVGRRCPAGGAGSALTAAPAGSRTGRPEKYRSGGTADGS